MNLRQVAYNFFRGAAHSAEARSVDTPGASVGDILGSPTRSDNPDHISTHLALRISTIYAIAKIIGEDIAGRDIRIEVRDGAKWRQDQNHELNALFQQLEPYALLDVIQSVTASAVITGNGIAPIKRNARTALPKAILIRDDREIGIFQTYERDKIIYQTIDSDGKHEILFSPEVLHIKNLTLDGRTGLSAISYNARMLNMSVNATKYVSDNYQGGGFGGGMVTTDKQMSASRRLSFGEQIREAQRRGIYPILDDGFKFYPNTISPKDIEYIQTMNLVREDIAAMNRVPFHLVANTKAPGSNLEQQNLSYLKYCLLPWARKWEDELERKLLSVKDRNKVRIKWDFSSFLRGDTASQADYYSKLIAAQVLVPDEVRAQLGYDERPDGKGNQPVDNQKSALESNGGPSIHNTKKSTQHEEE